MGLVKCVLGTNSSNSMDKVRNIWTALDMRIGGFFGIIYITIQTMKESRERTKDITMVGAVIVIEKGDFLVGCLGDNDELPISHFSART